jgi:hypothetical protein
MDNSSYPIILKSDDSGRGEESELPLDCRELVVQRKPYADCKNTSLPRDQRTGNAADQKKNKTKRTRKSQAAIYTHDSPRAPTNPQSLQKAAVTKSSIYNDNNSKSPCPPRGLLESRLLGPSARASGRDAFPFNQPTTSWVRAPASTFFISLLLFSLLKRQNHFRGFVLRRKAAGVCFCYFLPCASFFFLFCCM